MEDRNIYGFKFSVIGLIGTILTFIFTIIVPLVVIIILPNFIPILSETTSFDPVKIMIYGSISTILVIFYYFSKDKTLLKFIASLSIIISLIIFYIDGNSIYSLFFPNRSFGIIGMDILGAYIIINLIPYCILNLILWSLIATRRFLNWYFPEE